MVLRCLLSVQKVFVLRLTQSKCKWEGLGFLASRFLSLINYMIYTQRDLESLSESMWMQIMRGDIQSKPIAVEWKLALRI